MNDCPEQNPAYTPSLFLLSTNGSPNYFDAEYGLGHVQRVIEEGAKIPTEMRIDSGDVWTIARLFAENPKLAQRVALYKD